MELVYHISGTNGDIEIDFTDEALHHLDDSDGSLVFPIYHKHFVMSFHSKRKGWELPAGRREAGETPEECGKRETFEETGAVIVSIKPIGYYIVNNKRVLHKTAIFIARVDRFEPKPSWSETGLVKLFDDIPENITYQDDVYSIIFEHVKHNLSE